MTAARTVEYQLKQQPPLLHSADVIVVGGGPGGIGAAVMAARAGADTLLIERYGFLGGMAVSGEVHPFMHNHVDGKPLDGPVYLDWIEKMKELWPREGQDLCISKDAAMLAAEKLCLEAGVRILYHHTLVDVVTDTGGADLRSCPSNEAEAGSETCPTHISSLILHSKSGFSAAQAKVYIDCTGDADLAARAGCECEQGGPSGNCQPMTLCFKLSHVDIDRMPDGKAINGIYDDAKANGELVCPREDVLKFAWFDDDVMHFNTTRVVKKSGTNGIELSEAELEAHEQVRQYLDFFRKHVPGFENAQLHSVGHHIGIRETRRVRGMAYLTREDFRRSAKFPDAIARVNYPIDIHNPDGSGTEHERLEQGEWYEIPYGCIVARDADNLLVGGRPISVDHAVHSSMRVMPPACTVGQAAGMAAAMAVAQGCTPTALDGEKLREHLREAGAKL